MVRIGASGLFIVDFEGAAAIGADVVEAALWFARVDDLAASTVRACDDISERSDHRRFYREASDRRLMWFDA